MAKEFQSIDGKLYRFPTGEFGIFVKRYDKLTAFVETDASGTVKRELELWPDAGKQTQLLLNNGFEKLAIVEPVQNKNNQLNFEL